MVKGLVLSALRVDLCACPLKAFGFSFAVSPNPSSPHLVGVAAFLWWGLGILWTMQGFDNPPTVQQDSVRPQVTTDDSLELSRRSGFWWTRISEAVQYCSGLSCRESKVWGKKPSVDNIILSLFIGLGNSCSGHGETSRYDHFVVQGCQKFWMRVVRMP